MSNSIIILYQINTFLMLYTSQEPGGKVWMSSVAISVVDPFNFDLNPDPRIRLVK